MTTADALMNKILADLAVLCGAVLEFVFLFAATIAFCGLAAVTGISQVPIDAALEISVISAVLGTGLLNLQNVG